MDEWYKYDRYGNYMPRHDVSGMFFPVECAYCHTAYDIGEVEVTARYIDCSVWESPCCNRTVDDRGETGWKSTKDYYPLDNRGMRK